jgi:mannose-6-phosphate isomerase-like protein (cupin superfamily)
MSHSSDSQREFATSERCHIIEYLNRDSLPSVSVARARVEPGVTTALHRVDADEWYLILSGEGTARVGGCADQPVGPGDTVHIPRGCAQQIANTGHEDLLFFCVCVPRFTPAAYESLE